MKHTDIAGRELAVGDTVALTVTGYRDMQLGTVQRFTPKGMQVQTERLNWRGEPDVTFRAPNMVCKVVTP